MNIVVPTLWLGLAAAAVGAVSERPLAEAAAQRVGELEAGGIVTGESVGGKRGYHGVGDLPGGAVEALVFEMGSITKVFTGLLLADMVVRGEVTLETTVAEVLGDGVRFKDPRVGAITLRQLATHSSGLPRLPTDLSQGAAQADPYAHYDEDRLRHYLSALATVGEGPHEASYSNLGFGLLGYLLGQVAGRPWQELIQTRICGPLGLRHTAVEPEGGALVRVPPFAGGRPALAWHLAAMEAAGALRTTVEDLVAFGEALAAPDRTPLAAAMKLACEVHGESPAGGDMGLGIMIARIDGERCLVHDGGTGGFRAGLQVIPERRLVRVALINNTTLAGSAVIAGTRRADHRAKPEQVPLPVEELDDYTGVYELRAGVGFTVLRVREGLRVRLTGQPFFPVFLMGKDRFFYKAVDAELQFERSDDTVASVTLFQNGQEKQARRVEGALPQVIFRPAAELAAYEGTYPFAGVGDLKVTVRANTLFAQLADQPALPVFEEAPERFVYDVVEAALVFAKDEAGRVTEVVLEQNGQRLKSVKKTP